MTNRANTYFAALLLFFVTGAFSLKAEEPSAEATKAPVLWAKPVEQHQGIGKILGKTMKTVSHKGASIIPKFSKTNESTDKGAPDAAPHKIFDSHRGESPIRTARLFTIQINPPVEVQAVKSDI
ncbi:MAG: hypothetical protein P1U89_22980 [Verrucomicrobiales bacterium]|nr:hypothetical protein [Verrucomicrobiales bacterium]